MHSSNSAFRFAAHVFQRSLLAAALFSFAGIASDASKVFAQGSLTPSAAPAASMKTLSQLEPRTPISTMPYSISAAGAYYLTTNLIGPGNITIATNNVSLDLGGFTVTSTSSAGILVNAAGQTNVSIRNGIIRDCFGDGISAYYGVSVQGMIVEGVQVGNCGLTGFRVQGNVLIHNCTFSGNGESGVEMTSGIICDSIASGNKIYGINGPGTIRNCQCNNNGDAGIRANYSFITGCSIANNATNGIYANYYSRIHDNIIKSHAGLTGKAGIFVAGPENDIQDNTLIANQFGILATNSTPNLIAHNVFSQNTSGGLVTAAGNIAPAVTTYNSTTLSNASYWININN